jgi:Rad3-related DNA helicase
MLIAEKEDDELNHKKTKSLVIAPIKLASAAKAYIWPNGVQKLLLMSATFNHIDAAQLGLSEERIGYFKCPSIIPPQRRPFVYSPLWDMSYKNQDKSMPGMAQDIQLICDAHPNEKGVVHCTYNIAVKLQKYLKDSRFIFHTQIDKDIQYRAFRANKHNAVLIASGMDEGIDLADDFGRFQIIAKVQYLGLGDPLVVAKKNEIYDWYVWEAIRSISQAYGRICRNPDDEGITYFLDSCLNRLWNRIDLWPEWIKDARYKIAPDDFRKLMQSKINKETK